MTVAYNLLALNIPCHYIPFRYAEHYGKVIQKVGGWNQFDKTLVIGDLDNWDFMVLYAF
jgi:hypothetical protein